MPYSNGATLRFLLPIPFRNNYQDCNLTRLSQSSDSVYHDEADDVVGSIIPLAYRPMSALGVGGGGSSSSGSSCSSSCSSINGGGTDECDFGGGCGGKEKKRNLHRVNAIRLLNLARLGYHVQFVEDVIDNEKPPTNQPPEPSSAPISQPKPKNNDPPTAAGLRMLGNGSPSGTSGFDNGAAGSGAESPEHV
nr:putative lysozyme-like protein [Aedes albopictus]